MQFIDLQAQYRELESKIDNRIKDVLRHGQYIMGPEVGELEDKLAEYVGVKHAITCANGTDALVLALMAIDVKPNDLVFCPTFTFFATAEAPAFLGATPVFVDSNPDTFNICPENLVVQIEAAIKSGLGVPKAIIAVDLFGLPADYTKLEAIAKNYGMTLIEDAAQGFGGRIGDRKAGSFGDIATTSFFPAKPLGCYGDGGAIFTDSNELADLIRSLRVHGKGEDKYDNVRIGQNSRLDTIQAAVLLEKLKVFDHEIMQKNKIASFYNKRFADQFVLPKVPDGFYSSWAQYTLRSENRNNVMDAFGKNSVPTMIYYRTCMHNQTAFRHLGQADSDFPNAHLIAQQVFSLPMHPYLNPESVCL